MTPEEELFGLAELLGKAALGTDDAAVSKPVGALEQASQEIKRSFCGSWLGYHAHVYYAGLAPPPPGANFSQEWGTRRFHSGSSFGSRGDWEQFDPEDVKARIREMAGQPDLGKAHATATGRREFSRHRSRRSRQFSRTVWIALLALYGRDVAITENRARNTVREVPD